MFKEYVSLRLILEYDPVRCQCGLVACRHVDLLEFHVLISCPTNMIDFVFSFFMVIVGNMVEFSCSLPVPIWWHTIRFDSLVCMALIHCLLG